MSHFIWGQQCCARQARPHTWIPEQGTLLCWNYRSWCHRQGREFFLWYWVVCFFIFLKTVCCLLWMKAYESTEMLSSVKWGKSILKKGAILWNWRRYNTRHFFDTKMTCKTFCQPKKAVKRTGPQLWWWWKPSRRRLWRNATSHNIRENCHPPKSAGPLVHFSQTSCKRMPYR